ncbi:hypothetical protein D3C80_723400 [compost metagenome]
MPRRRTITSKQTASTPSSTRNRHWDPTGVISVNSIFSTSAISWPRNTLTRRYTPSKAKMIEMARLLSWEIWGIFLKRRDIMIRPLSIKNRPWRSTVSRKIVTGKPRFMKTWAVSMKILGNTIVLICILKRRGIYMRKHRIIMEKLL